MLSRVFTWLFYAIVFFALGAWTNSHFGSVGKAVDYGLEKTGEAAVSAWQWASGGTGTVKTDDPAAGEQAAAPAGHEAEPVAPPPAATSGDLADARTAFQKGDVGAAVEAYLDYLETNPADIEARGELGNVYYGAGRIEEAATTYFDVATRLLDLGDTARAGALEAAIRRGNPGLADELKRRLGG